MIDIEEIYSKLELFVQDPLTFSKYMASLENELKKNPDELKQIDDKIGFPLLFYNFLTYRHYKAIRHRSNKLNLENIKQYRIRYKYTDLWDLESKVWFTAYVLLLGVYYKLIRNGMSRDSLFKALKSIRYYIPYISNLFKGPNKHIGYKVAQMLGMHEFILSKYINETPIKMQISEKPLEIPDNPALAPLKASYRYLFVNYSIASERWHMSLEFLDELPIFSFNNSNYDFRNLYISSAYRAFQRYMKSGDHRKAKHAYDIYLKLKSKSIVKGFIDGDDIITKEGRFEPIDAYNYSLTTTRLGEIHVALPLLDALLLMLNNNKFSKDVLEDYKKPKVSIDKIRETVVIELALWNMFMGNMVVAEDIIKNNKLKLRSIELEDEVQSVAIEFGSLELGSLIATYFGEYVCIDV